VQIAFTVVVFPCLLLQYTGQAAYIAQNKDHVSHAFYFSLPGNVGQEGLLVYHVYVFAR
jgi:KUP system potassium uptake protein